MRLILEAVLDATGQYFAEVEAERAVAAPALVEAAAEVDPARVKRIKWLSCRSASGPHAD
jgi:hypothetical protein